MKNGRYQKHFFVSVIGHVVMVLVLVLGFDHITPLPVLENTNKNDVISAVVLGDTPKSKILPQQPIPQLSKVEKEKPKVEPKPVPKTVAQNPLKDAIALKITKKKQEDKKKIEEKKLVEKKQKDLAKNLLADIEKLAQKPKKKEKSKPKLESQFQKLLREQSEKSLRQQLLNEEIKLQGTQVRQAQGEVNKYKALILQAISEHWIIPLQANKKLYCELMIRIAPGGMVLDVRVTKTSGDPSLDSSARSAVLKASPLPVPKDTNAFEPFRQFVLKVKPENILSSDGGLS